MSKGSGKLRTQIGWSSRRIKDLLEEEEIPKEKEIRDSSDVEELIHVIGTTIHLGEKLTIEIQRIKELERQWEEIIVNDSKELEKKQQYINKYGDFTTTTKEGQEFVDKLHTLYQIAIEKLQKVSPEEATHVESWEQIMHSDSAPRPVITNSTPVTSNIPTTIPTINASIPISTSTLNSLNSYPVPSITATTTYSLPAPIVEPSQVPMTGIPTIQQNYATVPVGQMRLGLPTMPLPTFDGNITKFMEFTESFDSMMNMMQLDDLSRFYYLKGSLRGAALELVEGISTLHKNYAVARQVLSQAYGGSLRLKNTHNRGLEMGILELR